jgi:hypothetical protein
MATAAASSNTTLTIFEIVELTKSKGLALEARRVKVKVDVKPGQKPSKPEFEDRYFLNRVGIRGYLNITCGDCTRGGDYAHPYLGTKPDRHKDSAADSTSKGALTIIPDVAEGAAWVAFNHWIKEQIILLGCINDKKGNPVKTLEKLENEFKDLVMEPVPGNDAKKNVCFWQKLQIGGKIPDLTTRFHYIRVVKDVHGTPVALEQSEEEFDHEELVAGSPFYSYIQMGELKKAPTGWCISLYARQAFTAWPEDKVAKEPTVTFGGLSMVKASVFSPAPEASVASAPHGFMVTSEILPVVAEAVAEPEPEEKYVAPLDVKPVVAAITFDPAVNSDMTKLSQSLAKFADTDRDAKRAKTSSH